MPFHLHPEVNLLMAVAIQLPLCLIAWKLKYLTRGGMIAALAACLMVVLAFGWPGYGMLMLYAMSAFASTSLSVYVLNKKGKTVDEGKLKPRTFGHVFVRTLPSVFAALIVVLSTEPTTRLLGLIACLAAMASALGDIVSTELGQAYGRRTYKLITLERVKSGTRGGVSMEGSILGGVAVLVFAIASMLAFSYSSVSFHYIELGVKEVLIITMAALIANHVESTLGGIFTQFQRKPSKLLLGFLGSSLGALLAVFFTNLPEG